MRHYDDKIKMRLKRLLKLSDSSLFTKRFGLSPSSVYQTEDSLKTKRLVNQLLLFDNFKRLFRLKINLEESQTTKV